MGHTRLGRLPKTRRWQEVVQLLGNSPEETEAVVAATLHAAEARLRELPRDGTVGLAFWLLARVAAASREPDFVAELSALGLAVDDSTTTLSLVSQLADRTRAAQFSAEQRSHFTDIASLALRSALSETVAQQGRGLFGTSLDDVQAAFRRYSAPEQFARLSRLFFADFLARTLSAAIDRELSNHVGPGRSIADVQASREFDEALDLYARQSGRIVQDFARGWYGKHNWLSGNQITQEEARNFVGVAMRKLRSELKMAVAV